MGGVWKVFADRKQADIYLHQLHSMRYGPADTAGIEMNTNKQAALWLTHSNPQFLVGIVPVENPQGPLMPLDSIRIGSRALSPYPLTLHPPGPEVAMEVDNNRPAVSQRLSVPLKAFPIGLLPLAGR